ncbi:histidine-phosphotransfer domain HPT domain-containing protein [Lactarius pseudohatsudake]|nr:histidine-phosphotransfer domain HPT domain-containing protein [Lactarius pseudohatsudake]
MPVYISPLPPVTTRPIDDPRPTPTVQAPLSSPPSTHRTDPAPVPTKPTPTSVAEEDSGPPPGAKSDRYPGIDMDVFEQILELDEDDDDFSRGMVDDYFSQAEKTFTEMAAALEEKDLEKLSSLGHFLKGSSAALGVFKVQSSCEDIQHYGQLREGNKVIEKDDAIAKIRTTLERAREEYQTAKSTLEQFYEEDSEPGEVSD